MEFVTQYLVEILTGTNITAIVVWLFDRKKRANQYAQLVAELKSKETENDKSVVDLYQEALDDLKKRYDVKFEELSAELKTLKTNLDLWKGKYRTLKKEFDDYRKQHEPKS
jgi:molecular chaperone GrpE (heat shock protein)